MQIMTVSAETHKQGFQIGATFKSSTWATGMIASFASVCEPPYLLSILSVGVLKVLK